MSSRARPVPTAERTWDDVERVLRPRYEAVADAVYAELPGLLGYRTHRIPFADATRFVLDMAFGWDAHADDVDVHVITQCMLGRRPNDPGDLAFCVERGDGTELLAIGPEPVELTEAGPVAWSQVESFVSRVLAALDGAENLIVEELQAVRR